MAVQTINLGGKRFVVLPEKDYLALRGLGTASSKAPKSKPARSTGSIKRRRDTEAGDAAESKRRLAEGGTKPYSQVRKELGLE